jgi:hypothetical protein
LYACVCRAGRNRGEDRFDNDICESWCSTHSLSAKQETRIQVLSGYRLPRPSTCEQSFYEIMLRCWKAEPEERPNFTAIVAVSQCLSVCLCMSVNLCLFVYLSVSLSPSLSLSLSLHLYLYLSLSLALSEIMLRCWKAEPEGQ